MNIICEASIYGIIGEFLYIKEKTDRFQFFAETAAMKAGKEYRKLISELPVGIIAFRESDTSLVFSNRFLVSYVRKILGMGQLRQEEESNLREWQAGRLCIQKSRLS